MVDYTNPTRIGYRGGRSGGDANMTNVPYATGSAVDDTALVMCFITSSTIRVVVPADWDELLVAVDGGRSMQVLSHRITEADLAAGSKSFTLTSAAGVTWSSMTLRGVGEPEGFIIGTPWTRSSSTAAVSALSVNVPRAGDLVLSLMAEDSANTETEAQVGISGATRWFFQPHQTTIPHTHLVAFVDTAAQGSTSTVNALWPAASASSEAIGVQIVIPGAEIEPPPIPSSLFAGTFGFGSTWLTVGARTQDVLGQVRVDATPVLGGSTIVSPTLSTPDAYGWVSCRVGGLTPNVAYNLVMVDISTGTALATVQATTTGGIRSDFKVLTSSCQKSDTDVAVYADMAAEGAAFFSHQGDLHYQDASTEPAWRFGLNANMSQPGMKAFLASIAMTYHWDNHDWGGNQSWRESPPKDFAPQAIRNLMGTDTFTDPSGLWRTWTHNGVRFIDTDQYTKRDEADTTPETNNLPGKTMWGVEQREWFFDVVKSSAEPLIVWFSSFPLYGNYVTNGRWGNYRDEAAIIDAWFDAYPGTREKIVAVGGDSHDIRADDGTNTMWGIPSLNASPLNRIGDAAATSGSSPWWNVFQGPATMSGTVGTIDIGVYSLLTFTWSEDKTEVTLTWEAKRAGGVVIATWSETYGGGAGVTAGVTRLVGGAEQPVAVTRLQAKVEVPVTVERFTA